MHRKLLNSDCLIAYSFCFFLGHWLKRKPVSSHSMLVNRIICLVSFLFVIWKFLFIYLSIENDLCMGFAFVVSYIVCKKWHEQGNFYRNFQILKWKLVWSLAYIKFLYMVCLCIWWLSWTFVISWFLTFTNANMHNFIYFSSKSACTLHSKVRILLLFCDWV